MERTLKEKQGAVGEEHFSLADEVMSLGKICCLEHGVESRHHITCWRSRAHRSETQGCCGHSDAVFSRNPQRWLKCQGSHFRCGEQGCSSFKQKNSLEIYHNSEAGAPCSGILILCVCIPSTYFFGGERGCHFNKQPRWFRCRWSVDPTKKFHLKNLQNVENKVKKNP